MTHKRLTAGFWLAAAAAVGVLAFGASPAVAEDGHYPPGGWQVQDTAIGPDVDWSDCDPGPVRVDSARSAIVDATTVRLVGAGVSAPPHHGTSIETGDLALPVSVGDVVSVDYRLDRADAAGDAIRLFIYDHPDGDTDCEAPAAFAAVPDDGSTAGTLTVRVPFDGAIGTAGLVYDSSNGGGGGIVEFSNLAVAGTSVSFAAPPEPSPSPSVEPSPSVPPSVEPSATPPASIGDELPQTGAGWTGLGLAAAGLLALVGVVLFAVTRRKRVRFEA